MDRADGDRVRGPEREDGGGEKNATPAGGAVAPDPPPALRAGRRLNRAYHRRLGRRTHDPRGVDVVAADWDLLVVLDACRYDAFAARNALAGDLRRRRSRGSHTAEFLWGNFAGRELHDVVYVTANVQPYVYREALSLHHLEHAWVAGFDEAAGTVPPAAVTEAALAAAERFPRKRLVVHYLQPHYPFLDGPDFGYGTMAFWDAVAAGAVDVSPADLRAAHGRNLARALPAVAELLAGVEGRAVVTADHGTALGERVGPVPVREWGHPWGVYAEPLVAVPWLVSEAETRPDVVPEPPADADPPDRAVVEERLAALGYG